MKTPGDDAPEPNRAGDLRPTLFQCGQCGKRFRRETTTVFPFCSRRCQLIDLGHWLNEEHGLPIEESYEGPEEQN